MRIGILTQPLLNNYGGLLQNYALQQVLKGMGHNVETIDWNGYKKSFKQMLWKWRQRLFYMMDKSVELPRYLLTDEESVYISQNSKRFIQKYITVSPEQAVKRSDFFYIAAKYKYDAYVVGSDQVWRPSYNPFIKSMFLEFTKNMEVRRIAYAASFGTSSWEYKDNIGVDCAALARKFDLITVRERSGVELCSEHLGVKATHVLDPTMLLNMEDYIRVVEAEQESKSAGSLFHYILDPSEEKKSLIDEIAFKQGLKPFTIMPKCQAENRTKWDVRNRIDDCVFPSVTSWLRAFMDSKMIMVDSFHGAVFSIIFNKPFWVFANSKRGNARFESLLGMFGLEGRLISTDSLNEDFDWNKPIDWVKVNVIREQERKRSIELLKAALN